MLKNFDFRVIVKFLCGLHEKDKQMEKSEYWRGNDGFSLVPEVKVTLLIDSSMVFFANFSGISMVGGWIYRNVFLLIIDSTKLPLFVLFVVRGRVQKSAQSEGRKGRKGVSMNNDTDYQLARI